MKKVTLCQPYCAEVPVGAVESHYGVSFTVVEDTGKMSTLTAELEDEDADAMVAAGRGFFADEPAPIEPQVDPAPVGKKAKATE